MPGPAPAVQPPYDQSSYPTTPATVYGFSQPSVGLSSTSGGSKRKLILIILAGVVVLGLLAGGAVLLFKGDNNPISSIANTVKGDDEVVSRSDGTLDLSNLIDEQTSIKAQDIKAKLNQQVNLSDGTSYMVLAVQRNFTTDSTFLKAGTGKELIKVDLVIGNRMKEGDLFISSSQFKVRNSAGGLQEAEYATSDDLADALEGQDLAPGKQVKGSIVFEVDKDEPISALVTSDKYKNYSTNEEITINSEVSLQ